MKICMEKGENLETVIGMRLDVFFFSLLFGQKNMDLGVK